MVSTLRCQKCGSTGHWPSSCQYNRHGMKLDRPPPPSLNKRSRNKNTDEGCDDDIIEIKVEPKPTRRGVYVIQYGDNQIFVGRSLDIDARIIQHQNGEGAHCIQNWDLAREIPTLTDPIHNDLESWERNETLLRMTQFGINKVRGWMFQNKILTTPERTEAFNQICEKFDSCRRCGKTEHHTHRCTVQGSFAWWMESV